MTNNNPNSEEDAKKAQKFRKSDYLCDEAAESLAQMAEEVHEEETQ